MAPSRRRGGQNRRRCRRPSADEIRLRNDPRLVEAIGVQPGEKDAILENAIKDEILAWKGFPGRPGQVAALYYALIGSQDVLLQAPTGYGKSVIWELVYKLGNRTVLMISPLNMLTEQQVKNLPPGSAGLALTHVNNNKDTMKEILNDSFTHICTSPEIACGQFFHKMVIQKGGFRDGRRPLVVIIDEVHMVDQWSKFRVHYSKIKFLKYRLPNGTKFVGVSGTLDDETRRKVIENGGFRCPIFLNTFIDRPEIHIELRADPSIGTSYSGLRFLFPDELPSEQPGQAFEVAKQLPKTMVFFDRKKDQRIALSLCRKWLEDAGLELFEARKVVGIYHAGIREREKAQIRDAFLPLDSEVRVMLVTEAMGMGVEIPGIKLVVQYGAREILRDRSSFKTLVQRMGRAARGRGETGWFIWLLPPWFFASPDTIARDQVNYQPSMLSQSATIQAGSQKIKYKASDIRQYTALDPLYKRLNSECPRQVIADFFTPEGSELAKKIWPDNSRCCNSCDKRSRRSNGFPPRCDISAALWPDIIRAIKQINSDTCRFDRELMLRLPADMTPASTPYQFGPVWYALLQWRKKKLADIRIKCGQELVYMPDMLGEGSILPDDVARKLAQMNNFLNEDLGPRFLEHFVAEWALRDEVVDKEQDPNRTFGDEALEVVQRHSATQFPVGKSEKQFQYASKVLERHRRQLKDEKQEVWDQRQIRRIARYGETIPRSAMPGDAVEAQCAPRPRPLKPKQDASQETANFCSSQMAKDSQSQKELDPVDYNVSFHTAQEHREPEGDDLLYFTSADEIDVVSDIAGPSSTSVHQHSRKGGQKRQNPLHSERLPSLPSSPVAIRTVQRKGKAPCVRANPQDSPREHIRRQQQLNFQTTSTRTLAPLKRKKRTSRNDSADSASDTESDTSGSHISRSGRRVTHSLKLQALGSKALQQ